MKLFSSAVRFIREKQQMLELSDPLLLFATLLFTPQPRWDIFKAAFHVKRRMVYIINPLPKNPLAIRTYK